MFLSAILLVCDPGLQPALIKQIQQLEWAEVQLQEPSKVIVTVEALDQAQATERFHQLEPLTGIVNAQVTAFYLDQPTTTA